jgi:hypothetical protein
MFPNALAKWRLVEILAFIERYDTDVLVPAHAGKSYTFDWDALRESHRLSLYEVLIFDSAFNDINKHNKVENGGSGLDGTAFNNRYPGAYLLRLRKFSGTPFDARVYAAVYHIFLWEYHQFNLLYGNHDSFFYGEVPYSRQMIHLYPGGGLWVPRGKTGNLPIDDAVALVATQVFTAAFVREHYPNNALVAVFGCPYLNKGEHPSQKLKKRPGEPLVVCFTSLGDIKEKGADHYVSFAEAFHTRYPRDNVVFWGIGNVPPSPIVQVLPAMPQAELDKVYADRVDVYITCENTDRMNGWPLGSEAVLRGAVLFATDDNNYNDGNGYFFSEGFTRLGNRSADNMAALEQLHRYAEDFNELHRHSVAIQQRAVKLFSFTAQMQPIFLKLDATIKAFSGGGLKK